MGKKRSLNDEELNKELSEVRDKLAVEQLTYNETRTDEAEVNVCLAYAQNFIRTTNQIWFDAPPVLQMKLQQ
jgi:hypothetical protein